MHSHPSVRPCDVYPDVSFRFGDVNLPENDGWKVMLQSAPRAPPQVFDDYTETHYCRWSASCTDLLRSGLLAAGRYEKEWAALYPEADY